MEGATLKNFVSISPEGFIEIKVTHIKNEADAMDVGKRVIDLVTMLEDEGKQIKVLIDSSKEKTYQENIIPILTIIFSDINFKKGAIFGSNTELKNMQATVIKKAGIDGTRARFFNTRDEAVPWLSQD